MKIQKFNIKQKINKLLNTIKIILITVFIVFNNYKNTIANNLKIIKKLNFKQIKYIILNATANILKFRMLDFICCGWYTIFKTTSRIWTFVFDCTQTFKLLNKELEVKNLKGLGTLIILPFVPIANPFSYINKNLRFVEKTVKSDFSNLLQHPELHPHYSIVQKQLQNTLEHKNKILHFKVVEFKAKQFVKTIRSNSFSWFDNTIKHRILVNDSTLWNRDFTSVKSKGNKKHLLSWIFNPYDPTNKLARVSILTSKNTKKIPIIGSMGIKIDPFDNGISKQYVIPTCCNLIDSQYLIEKHLAQENINAPIDPAKTPYLILEQECRSIQQLNNIPKTQWVYYFGGTNQFKLTENSSDSILSDKKDIIIKKIEHEIDYSSIDLLWPE